MEGTLKNGVDRFIEGKEQLCASSSKYWKRSVGLKKYQNGNDIDV